MNTVADPAQPTLPELIIVRPHLQSNTHRSLYRALTLVAWSLYLYLWLPLATLALWWISMHLGYRKLMQTPEFIDVGLFVILIENAVIAIVVLIGWAEYNRWRFQGQERRHAQPNVTTAETAAMLGVAADVATALRRSRNANVSLDQDAVPVAVRTDALVSAASKMPAEYPHA